MSTAVTENDDSCEQVVVDGQPMTPEQFSQLREEVGSDPNRKLSEVSPGVYKTLQRLDG